MRYFHLSITCPECNEPHLNGTPLDKLDSDLVKCNSCGCIFTNKLNFSKERFPHTFEEVYRKNRTLPEESKSTISLSWPVESNPLEKSYIDWLKDLTPPNNILVTWPWKKVKFIPILLIEYLLKNEEKKVAVIDEVNSNINNNIIYQPHSMESFNQTIFYKDESKLNSGNMEISREMKMVDSFDFVKLETIVEYEIKRAGRKDRTRYTTDENVIQCKNRILKEVESDYGENCVRYLTIKRLEKENKKSVRNPYGKIDIRIEEKKYAGKFKYDKRWLWENLLNTDNLIRARNKFPPMYLTSASVASYSGYNNLFFLNEDDDHEFLFDKLKEIQPALVILPDCDWFIKDKLWGGPRYRSLVRFLKQNNACNVIMFSTGKDYRHLYNIYETTISEELKVTVHTCDSDVFLNKFLENNSPADKYYDNPLSSMWKEIRKHGNKRPLINYVTVPSMDAVQEKLNSFDTISIRSLRGDIIHFFRELLRSFLDLYGNPSSAGSFKRNGDSLDILSFDSVMGMIKEKLGEPVHNEVYKILNAIYTINGVSHSNPLWIEARKVLLNRLQIENNIITIIVNYYDLKGTQSLILSPEIPSNLRNRIRISTWNTLANIESDIPSSFNHIILATSYPGIGYSLYSSKAKEFIFLGATTNIEQIKGIVNNRLNDLRSRPFKFLSEQESAPNIVKEVNIMANTLISDTIQEVVEDLVLRKTNYDAVNNNPENKNGEYDNYTKIKAGEEALLLIDSMGDGMFIPLNSSLTVKEKDNLDEIELSQISHRDLDKTLAGKNILLDPEGLHRSFKALFISYMKKYAESTVFRKGPYEWNGFEELFMDSQRWIYDLRRTVENYRLKDNIDEASASSQLSNYLSSLNLYARDPEYIEKWWNDYELIDLGVKEYLIYRIEHPKSITDIQKIYDGINRKFPDMNLEPVNGERSYLASVFLQDFRRSLLTGRKLKQDLGFIHEQIKRDISCLLKESALFRVAQCFKIQLKDDVIQFKTLNNYKDYVKTEIT